MRLLRARLTVGTDGLGTGAARHVILGKRVLASQLCHLGVQHVVRFEVERRLAINRLIAGVGRVVLVLDVSSRAAKLVGRPIGEAVFDVFHLGGCCCASRTAVRPAPARQ